MNRLKFKIEFQQQNTERTFTYKVSIGNTSIYRGKIFVMPEKSSIELDLTDLLTNYQYKGLHMIEPIYDFENQCYTREPQSNVVEHITDSIQQQHRNTVQVVVYNADNNVVWSTNKIVYFHTTPFENHIRKRTNNNGVNYYFGSLTPRFPFGTSMSYTQLVDGDGTAVSRWRNETNSLLISTPRTTGTIMKSKSDSDIYDSDLKILQVDKCNAPYYLMYLTQDGGFQSQPFYNVKYSESITTNTKISVDEQKDISNLFVNGKWTLKSRNLTNSEYQEMMDIARSPYLYLYITSVDKGVFVNNVDTTIEKKVNGTDSNKPIYFEINLESREQQLNIF